MNGANPTNQLDSTCWPIPTVPGTEFASHRAAVEVQQQMSQAEKQFTTCIVAQDLAEPRVTRVLQRGEYNLPTGDPLKPGVLAVMGGLPDEAPQNRLGLARWLTSSDHPLVARVLINRVWQRTFGEGLVRTPEDFGLQGEQPTHPQLLDWLAVELQDSGWDLKHMLKLMVTSRTFRQRSELRDDIDDPQNRWRARGPRHRMDAEVIARHRPCGPVDCWTRKWAARESSHINRAACGWRLRIPPATRKSMSATPALCSTDGACTFTGSATSPHPMMTLFDAPDR